jgi:hypothetical protein
VGIKSGTINGIVTFKKSSRCKVTVTGGTETGHAELQLHRRQQVAVLGREGLLQRGQPLGHHLSLTRNAWGRHARGGFRG